MKLKKIIALFLLAAMMFSLPACGGSDAPPSGGEASNPGDSGGEPAGGFENKIAFSIDKSHYEKEERIEVTMNFADVDKDSAIIVIVSAQLAHGKLAPPQENTEEYRFISDFGEIPFYMWAPQKDGIFDVRIYAGSEKEELAFVSFAVGGAAIPSESKIMPPSDGSNVKQAYFNAPKAIYMDVLVGGSTATAGTYSFALLDGNYSYTLNNDGVFFHESAQVRTYYCPYGDGWAIDNDSYEYGQVPQENLVYEMTEYLDTFYQDAENCGYYNNIAKYYVGTQTVCYRNCYVYEIQDDGFGVYKKFWIDPENGATLKYVERENEETKYEFEVTQYNLLGPVWTEKMRPDYAAVTQTLF